MLYKSIADPVVNTDGPDFALNEATLAHKDHEDAATSPVPLESRMPASDILQGLEDSRRSTPVMPPGLPIPAGVAANQQRSSSPAQRPVQPITPAVPILPSTPLRAQSPQQTAEKTTIRPSENDTATKDSNDASTTRVNEQAKPQSHAHPARTQDKERDLKKQDVPESISNLPISAATRIVSEKPKEGEFGEASAASSESKPRIQQAQTSAPNSTATVTASSSGAPPKESLTKRQPPGKLDIPLVTQTYGGATATQSTSVNAMTPEKASQAASATSASASGPGTPAATIDSPLKKVTAPRTLRVLSTPKAETPPTASSTGHGLPSGKTLSRQPSVVSIDRSGTPASEIISEPNSTTSASLSRANSPPPVTATSKVGSAPIRTKTKSQLKKERQERAKAQDQESKVEAAQTPAAEEQVAAPLTGRKKKTKKEKLQKVASGKPSAATNRPPSPLPEETSGAENPEEVQTDVAATESKEETSSEIVNEQGTSATSPSPAPPKREFTPASVFADLQSAGWTVRNVLDHFKPVSSIVKHDITAADIAARDRPISLTDENRAALTTREPLRLGGEDGRLWSRTFVTPSQSLLRGLSREEEDRYIALERRILADGPPTKFLPQRKSGAEMETQLPAVMDFLVDHAQEAQPNPSLEGRDGNTDDAMMYLNQMVPPMVPAAGPGSGDHTEYRPSHSTITNTSGGPLPHFDFSGTTDLLSGAPGNPTVSVNANVGRATPFPGLGVKEAESAWTESKKKTDRLERELNALIKRNRKLLTGTVH